MDGIFYDLYFFYYILITENGIDANYRNNHLNNLQYTKTIF